MISIIRSAGHLNVRVSKFKIVLSAALSGPRVGERKPNPELPRKLSLITCAVKSVCIIDSV